VQCLQLFAPKISFPLGGNEIEILSRRLGG